VKRESDIRPNAPILINKNKQIIAGHDRFEAAKLNGCTQVRPAWWGF
jgi:hypothetical protein